MKFRLKDEITQKDVMSFIGLVLFLVFWIWLTFYSGWIV